MNNFNDFDLDVRNVGSFGEEENTNKTKTICTPTCETAMFACPNKSLICTATSQERTCIF